MDKFREINPDNFHSNYNNISLETIEKWEKVLVNSKTEFTKLIGNDIDLEDLTSDFKNRKEILNDCNRSRITERVNMLDFGILLEQLLILYCKINNVQYKQGMNEILGPFLLLKVNFPISNSRIFNLFSCFIDNFLNNYYYEVELYAFKSSVSLLTLLLRYHDPGLVIAFEHGAISPQMYATNWLLTTYANKLQLGIVYKLWDILIDENDQLFIHYVVIAFLKLKRDLFIGVDTSQILLTFSKIKIETMSELKKIITLARQIRLSTPFSFRILVQKLEIFKPRSKRLKDLYIKYNTDEMITLPILSSELLYIMFNNQVNCPDSQCNRYLKFPLSTTIPIMNQEEECYYCNLKEVLNKQYIVVDLRILQKDEEYFNEGSLPVKSFVSREELIQKDIDVPSIIYEKISDHKSKAHIILITKDTLYFPKYEKNYFCNKNSFNLFVSALLGKSQKVEREINDKEVQKLIKNNAKLSKRYKLKEYDNIKKIISYLQEKEYPHVSYVYGGFKEIHELSVKYSIQLVNHNPDKCCLCQKNKSKNEQIELFYQLYGRKNRSNSEVNLNANQSNNELSLSPLIERKYSIEILNFSKPIEKETSDEQDRYDNPTDCIEIDKMDEQIEDPHNKVFHCLLLKHNKYEYKDKVIVLTNNDVMKIYKMMADKTDLNTNSKENFAMLDLVKNGSILKYKRDQNIFEIEYDWIANQNEVEVTLNEHLTLDLFTDSDSQNFEKLLDEIILNNQEKKSKNDN